MTRVEPTPPATAQPPRRFHLPVPKFSIGRLIKLGLLVLILWVVVLIAKTGLWHIPLVSALVYRTPSTLHEVQPTADAAATLTERLSGLMLRTVVIPEGTLTALAQSGVQNLHLGVEHVSVAAEAGLPLELSFTIPSRHNAVIRLNITPSVDDQGKLAFTTADARVGDVRIPTWLIGQPTRLLLMTELQPFLKVLPHLRDARTADRGLVLSW